MSKVLITDKINKVAGDILEGVAQVDYKETLPEEELIKIIGDYDGLIVRSQTKVTPKVLEAAKNMKIIGRAGVGVDNIDINESTKSGIIVVNSPDGNTTAAAEHTVALMLSMSRHVPDANASTKTGKWERSKFTGTEVFKKTLGIIGLGKIGSRVAKAALGLGMRVVVYDPFASKKVIENLGASPVDSLENFWSICDYITVHVPKTKDTIDLINKDTIAKMKDGVRIINCARGGIVNENDLKEALDSGKVAQAAVDVFSSEPLKEDNVLLECKGDLILTPHLGASTEEAQINVAIDVAEQIRDVLSGLTARSAVNIPSLSADRLEPVKDYMGLAENLGKLARQISKGATQRLEVVTTGTLAQLDISPLKIAILRGMLSYSLEGVNFVNAPVIAKSRGIDIVETKSEKTTTYTGLLTVIITTDQEVHTVSGALMANNSPRIVKIDNYSTSIAPAENIIIAPHHDKPGMIAQVASVLGASNVNISMMQVARKDITAGGESIMIIDTDQPVDQDILEEIKEVDGIYDARYISLNSEKQEKTSNLSA